MNEEQDQRASSPPPPPPLETDFAGAVRLADYCAESPQSWFRNINSTFAASRVSRSTTKFHWVVSKLPVSLMDTIGHICDDQSVYPDPYQELQNILLESYGLSAAQKTAHLLDHLLANSKTILAWGFRRSSVCFSDQTFDFEFLLAAVATPLLGIDFLCKIWPVNHPL